ncbi:hypothetical protein PGB90_006496 [Kerria lacca]
MKYLYSFQFVLVFAAFVLNLGNAIDDVEYKNHNFDNNLYEQLYNEDVNSIRNSSFERYPENVQFPIYNHENPAVVDQKEQEQADRIFSKIENNHRVSVLEPKKEISSYEIPKAAFVEWENAEKSDGDNSTTSSESTEIDEADATEAPLVSPIIFYCIIASIILLLIMLLILIVVIIILAFKCPSDCPEERDATSKKSSCRISERFCDEGGSEQTVELMERGYSSRKGSCNICPKTIPRSSYNNESSVLCACDSQEDESYSANFSATSSASTTFKRCS